MSEKMTFVVAAFIHHEGRVLIAKRAQTKRIAPGKYHLPGGHVTFAEPPRRALAREIREEFGLEIEVGDPLDVFTYTTSACDQTVGIVFLATVRGDWHAVSRDINDNEFVAWLPLSEAEKVLADSGDFNLAAVVKGFQRLNCGCLLPEGVERIPVLGCEWPQLAPQVPRSQPQQRPS